MNIELLEPGPNLPFRFTDERTIKFVDLYGREPCLWNKRPYLRRARNAAYRRIQMGMNAITEPHESPMTIKGVKMKIKNLRTGYHQELRKIRTIEGYQPKTPWFLPVHEFLADYIDTNEHVTRNTPQLKRLQIRLTRLKPIKMQMEIKPEPDEMDSTEMSSPAPAASSLFTMLPTPMPLPMEEPPTPPPSLTKTGDANSVPLPVSGPIPLPLPADEKNDVSGTGLGLGVGLRGEDEFTFFGLSVAAQLRNMPLANAMVMQSRIQYMLAIERRMISGHSTDVGIFN
ncbi:hypothetical protein KR009_007931 [Drosophila setifemur]|nr:hypothetical protein KR009_007931 [Drosophila setifemur]